MPRSHRRKVSSTNPKKFILASLEDRLSNQKQEEAMSKKEFLLLVAGALLAMVLETTVSGFINPILAPAKLSYP
jgi:hypothetical protein